MLVFLCMSIHHEKAEQALANLKNVQGHLYVACPESNVSKSHWVCKERMLRAIGIRKCMNGKLKSLHQRAG